MSPDDLRDEILRASLRFMRDNGVSPETMKHIHHAFWRADERLGELTAKKLRGRG